MTLPRHRRIWPFICLILVVLTAGTSQANDIAEERQQVLNQIRQNLANHKPLQALTTVNKWLEKHPDEESLYPWRIDIFRQLNQSENLIAESQKLIKLRPYKAENYGSLAWEFINEGRFSEALPVALKAYELDRTSMPWAVNLGHCYFLQNDSVSAEKYYRIAVSLITSDEELKAGPLADFDLFIKKGWKVEEAKKWRAWFIAHVSPEQLRATQLVMEAFNYFDKNKFKEAESQLKEAQQLRKIVLGDSHYLTNSLKAGLAKIYLSQGRYTEAEAIYKNTLALLKKLLGENHPHYISNLSNLATIFHEQGRLSEAETLAKQALDASKKVYGEESTETLTSLNNLGEIYRDQGRYSEAVTLHKQGVNFNKKIWGENNPKTIINYTNLALDYFAQGKLNVAELLFKQSLNSSKEFLGESHTNTLTVSNNLASLFNAQGRFSEAEPLFKNVLQNRKVILGENHPNTIHSLNNLALLYLNEGRLSEAEPLAMQAVTSSKQIFGENHPATMTSMNNLAEIYRTQGRNSDAESMLKLILESRKKALGSDHPDVVGSLNNLATLFLTQGRYQEGESTLKDALSLSKKVLGDKHQNTLTILSNLAMFQDKNGHYIESESLNKQSYELRKNILGKRHPDTINSLNNLAINYYNQNKYDQAEALANKVYKLSQIVKGKLHPETLTGLHNLAMIYKYQGKLNKAEALLKNAIELTRNILGDKHPDTLLSVYSLATLYFQKNQLNDALPLYRELTKSYSEKLPDALKDKFDSPVLGTYYNEGGLFTHLDLLTKMQNSGSHSLTGLNEESLKVAQLTLRPSDAQVVAQMSLAYLSPDKRQQTQVDQLNDAIVRRKVLDDQFTAALTAEANKSGTDIKKSVQLKQAFEENERQIQQLDGELQRSFPAYSQIIRPTPVPLNEVQQILAGDEALLVYVSGQDASYVMAVTPGNAVMKKLPFGKAVLQQSVSQLRQALTPPLINQKMAPFDIELAHRLYQQLLAPVAHELVNAKRVFTVTDDALQGLPFQLLVASPPNINKFQVSNYNQVDWLVKHHAFSSLPSVKTFQVLRDRNKADSTNSQLMLGFGDPEFQGKATPSATRVPSIESIFRGDANTRAESLLELPRLAETAEELWTLARSLDWRQRIPAIIRSLGEQLGLIKQSVYLKAEASEAHIKEMSKTNRLDAKVLAFSTHAILAHEANRFKGVPLQAGLVLPAKDNRGEDGLLTGGEISQLNLHADWVLLSACNTATVEPGGEVSGLSELAKAFFLKGARTLLASHWNVNSSMTTYLVTDTFKRLRDTPKLARAEALRQSMVYVINNPDPKFAHPYYWAPFVIIGEGGV